MKALPAPYHDHADRLDAYLAARAALEAASGAWDEAYLAARHRHALALSHVGDEVSVTEKVEETV